MSSVQRPHCWTKWIQNHPEEISTIISKCSHGFFKQRDQSKFRWTFVHAVCSSRLPTNIFRNVFAVLRQKCLISLIGAKDSDGDTPLSSMIRSGDVDGERIVLLLQQVPSYTKHMLQNRNKKGETPIERAFDMKEWEAVGILLKECIQNRILPELTGIGKEASNSKTLLHKAFQRNEVEYLRIYLRVCRECNVKPGLLVPTKKGRTPWWYFLNNHKDLTLMRKALDILVEFEVDINELYIDAGSHAYLLHEAYRRNNADLVDCLRNAGANEEAEDARGLKPADRKRAIDFENVAAFLSPQSEVRRSRSSQKRERRRRRRNQSENQNQEREADTNTPAGCTHHQHIVKENFLPQPPPLKVEHPTPCPRPDSLDPAKPTVQKPPTAAAATSPGQEEGTIAEVPIHPSFSAPAATSPGREEGTITEVPIHPSFSAPAATSPGREEGTITEVHPAFPACGPISQATSPSIQHGTMVESPLYRHEDIVEDALPPPQLGDYDNNAFLDLDHRRYTVGNCGPDSREENSLQLSHSHYTAIT